MATPKQEKLITLLLDNLGKGGETKTLKEIMREAGYSEAMAKNPYQAIQGEAVQEGLANVVKDLNDLRQKALNELKARNLEKERFPDVVKAIDIYTKNAQLLSGQETERQGLSINVVKYNEHNDSA